MEKEQLEIFFLRKKPLFFFILLVNYIDFVNEKIQPRSCLVWDCFSVDRKILIY